MSHSSHLVYDLFDLRILFVFSFLVHSFPCVPVASLELRIEHPQFLTVLVFQDLPFLVVPNKRPYSEFF